MCGGKENLTSNKLAQEEINISMSDDHVENLTESQLQEPDLLSQNQSKVCRSRIYDVEKNKAFLKDVSERTSHVTAEKKAKGEPVGQFKMKSKYLKGVSQRKRDTATANELIRQHDNNTDINYRSYRIHEGWNARTENIKDDSQEARINEAIEAAHTWKLSWNMLKPNVLADCVTQVRSFYRQATLLSDAMNDPKYSDYFSSMPQDRYELLEQIVKTARPLVRAIELTFSGMGLSLEADGDISYKNERLTDEQRQADNDELSQLKNSFTDQREKLQVMDQGLVKHYTAMSKQNGKLLSPKTYQSTRSASAVVFDKLEKRGTLTTLDTLFATGTTKADVFHKDYALLMNRIMERDDFTFDENGFNMLYKLIEDRAKWEMDNDSRCRHFKKPELLQKSLDRYKELFDTYQRPLFEKVFKLVSKGVVGKDTAKLFLSPAAMCHQIKGFELNLYKTLAVRANAKEMSKQYEDDYQDQVIGLLGDLRHHVSRADLQKNNNALYADKYDFNPLETIKGAKSFVRFYAQEKDEGNTDENEDEESASDIRCYITVKEENQKDMIERLRNYLKKESKFSGAFTFKLMSTSNEHKLDNIVMYMSSKKTDPKLVKAFIDGFSKEIEDIATDEECIPTTTIVKKGIGLSAEPKDAFKDIYRLDKGFNPLGKGTFDVNQKIIYGKLTGIKMKKNSPVYELDTVHKNTEHVKTNLDIALNMEDEEILRLGTSNLSWNQYCSKLLILSSYVARHRLNRTEKDLKISDDVQVKNEMKQVFQEFMLLSGIDPDTLMIKSANDFFKTVTG